MGVTNEAQPNKRLQADSRTGRACGPSSCVCS